MQRQRLVLHPHDQAVFGRRGHFERSGQGALLHDQRVIAGRFKASVEPTKQALARVIDLGSLAVHEIGRTHHIATHRLANRLMPQAHAQDRDVGLKSVDHREAHTSFGGRARAGREHNGVRRHCRDFIEGDLVVAHDGDVCAEFAQEVDEIVGEAVVIIDDESTGHVRDFPLRQILVTVSFLPKRELPLSEPVPPSMDFSRPHPELVEGRGRGAVDSAELSNRSAHCPTLASPA